MKLLNRTMLLLLFAIVTMGWTAHGSLAVEKEPTLSMPSTVIPLDKLEDELENNSNDFTPFSTQYIRSGYSSIELLTESTLRVSGSTNAYIPVNTIRVTLNLQQWNPSQNQWIDVLAIGTATNNNSNFISHSRQVNIIRGYSYRIKAQHDVIHNGIIEQFTSVSTQIYVK